MKFTILQFSEFLVNLPSCTTITLQSSFIAFPHHPTKISLHICSHSIFPYFSTQELLIYILSLKMKWSFVDILCKLNHMICMWLLWFSIHVWVSSMLLHVSFFCSLLLMMGNDCFERIYHILCIHSLIDGHLNFLVF